jgi:hypothetical protein
LKKKLKRERGELKRGGEKRVMNINEKTDKIKE